jgi:lipopolysaccharide/colanic/teichoic acid biosynthesis glycosyltransferase
MDKLPQLLKEIEDIKTSIGEVQGSLNDLANLNNFDEVDTSKARSSMDSSYTKHWKACDDIRTMELTKLISVQQSLIDKLTKVSTQLNTALASCRRS